MTVSKQIIRMILACTITLSGFPSLAAVSPERALASTAVQDVPVEESNAQGSISQETTPVATQLKLQAPSTCSAKQTVKVTASLMTTQGAPIAGKKVIIEKVASPSVVLGSGSTDSSGRFSVSVTPASKIVVRARFSGGAPHLPSVSGQVAITPKVLLGAPWTHDKIVFPGQRLPARGTLWPKHSASSKATVIVCERWEKGAWKERARYNAKIVNTKSGSRYDAVIKLPSAGTWRVRARHADSGHATTYGPATKIKVTDWRRRYKGKRLHGFKTAEKMVAITIDDGPNARTLQVCSILEKYNAKGTFFFTRQMINRGYGPQLKKVYDRGHEVANHTANHKMLKGSYSHSYRQASLPMATIRKATGFSPLWVRAMGGGIDKTGMKAVVKTGQLYCNWSIDSYDSHRRYTPPGVLYHNVVDHVRPGDVILIHQTHPETIKALPRICKELRRKGYKMVTMSELAARSKSR